MLNCWRIHLAGPDGNLLDHFAQLEKDDNLPSFEDLEASALKLYRAYSSSRAQYRAMHDVSATSEWSKMIPLGTPWSPVKLEEKPVKPEKKSKTRTAKPKGSNKPPKVPSATAAALAKLPFHGDHVLAQLINLICDLQISREAAQAVASGDVGRVYETIKRMLFTFAGSSHSRYMGYVLETIMNLELESSPGLKMALLDLMLVNLSGMPGHFAEGDYIQEYFNRLLEDVVKHKGSEFDENFLREVMSRNIHHIGQLKEEWRKGVGLGAKSGKHCNPHERVEVRTLLKEYQAQELHSRRPGRKMDDRDTDDFARGLERLHGGAMQKYIDKTTQSRGLRTRTHMDSLATNENNEATAEEDKDDGDSNEEPGSESEEEETEEEEMQPTLGSMTVVDGELVIDDDAISEPVHSILTTLDALDVEMTGDDE
ncbi:hypothetical protein Hypma_010672 [Hypsizygus marmoreus]|uniref:DUF6589 domain-containing protein n=1 Tax=Hypsizygus marmoreus TaxID=39966 RepID=A0A369JR48_HYPMA|nr:hypothetical protein Hypma_010672 [Hypsizygus marmoreus]